MPKPQGFLVLDKEFKNLVKTVTYLQGASLTWSWIIGIKVGYHGSLLVDDFIGRSNDMIIIFRKR